jgi:hypothetical protein
MALIEEYHVVADYYEIDSDASIIEGQIVRLNAAGAVILCGGGSAAVLGISGDSSNTTQGYTPYAASLVVNSAGSTRSTSNRVSDMFNETLGSNKCTVYHSGGKFHTDQYETLTAGGAAITYAPGNQLWSSTNSRLTNVDSTGPAVGTCTATPRNYPSGVPGTNESGFGTTDGSISLGVYITFVLNVEQA